MNTLGMILLWVSVQIAVVGIACAILLRTLRMFDSTITLSGLLVACSLIVMGFAPLPSWWDAAASLDRGAPLAPPLATSPAPTDAPQASSSAAQQQSDPTMRFDSGEVNTWPGLEAFHWQSVAGAAAQTQSTSAFGWPAVFAICCLTAIGIGIVQLGLGVAAVFRLRARSTPLIDRQLQETLDVLKAELGMQQSVRLYQSQNLVTAATAGWLRPAVLLPPEWPSWSSLQRRAVLAHELVHIQRRDYLTSLLAQAGVAFQFYHPVMHWLSVRLRLDQELVADEMAAQLVGGRQSYMYCLVELAISQPDRTLGWPARNFLPTRGTFMRRIEMLRNSEDMVSRQTVFRRLAALGAIAAIGLLVMGLRSPQAPFMSSQLQAQEQTGQPPSDAVAGEFDLSLIPNDAAGLIAVRPAELLSHHSFQRIGDRLTAQLLEQTGLDLNQVDQITWIVHRISAPPAAPVFPAASGIGCVIRAKNTDVVQAFAARAIPDAKPSLTGITEIHTSADDRRPYAYFFADEHTLVIDHMQSIAAFVMPRRGAPKLAETEPWKRVSDAPIALVVDSDWLQDMLAPPGTRGPAEMFAQIATLVGPLYLDTQTVSAGFDLGEPVELKLCTHSSSVEQAIRVEATFEALLTLSGNMLRQSRTAVRQAAPEQQVIMNSLIDLAEEAVQSAETSRDEKTVKLDANLPLDQAVVLGILAPAIHAQREAAMRAQSANNLKQIGLALHNYHDAYGHFPPPVLTGPDGTTQYSWRVAVLPFLAQGAALFQQYRLDQPWDSENNRRVLSQMPAVYRDPHDQPQSNNASYFALVSPQAVMADDGQGTTLRQIEDGTSRTIVIAEARREIPWTKPEDIDVEADATLRQLGGLSEGGFQAVFADGSVRFLSKNIDLGFLRALITKAGGEASEF